ncbi:MAG: acetate/propionate family kinase [Rhizobium sp.]
MTETLLVLNAGSSSIKFKVFRLDDLAVLIDGKVSDIGGEAKLSATLPDDKKVKAGIEGNNHDAALSEIMTLVDRHDDAWRTLAVVHRIVHGGTSFKNAVVVTREIMKELKRLIPLAPLHQPHNLAGLAAAHRLAPDAENIACFDTAFHADHSDVISSFAVEKAWRDKGVRRYGFHGISYEWIAHVLAEEYPDLHEGKVVVAHLGNGASLCALQGGRSIDTTMGMTALDGLPMGTRCGAIDAGVVIFMQRELGLSYAEVEKELYERSGLKGLSGLTNDVEELLASSKPAAALALDYFSLRVAQYVAMMAVSMGGLDGIVFTGGIGEHAEPVRRAILANLKFLGDLKTLVIAANEEGMMALHAKRLLGS